MITFNHGHRVSLSACAVAALLLFGGCSIGDDDGAAADPAPSTADSPSPTAAGQHPSPSRTDPDPPRNPGEEMTDTPSPEASETAGAPEGPGADAMPASEPTAVSVPAIDVESEVMQLGLQDNGLIEVPPYSYGSPAGWYVHSPTPGELGPSVILGHRNGLEGGPGIFADLPQLQRGDSVEVTRQDGTTATFTIYRTDLVDKGEDFPTLDVYGNTAEPEIRLITCDGLNSETGILEDNFIAYGELDG